MDNYSGTTVAVARAIAVTSTIADDTLHALAALLDNDHFAIAEACRATGIVSGVGAAASLGNSSRAADEACATTNYHVTITGDVSRVAATATPGDDVRVTAIAVAAVVAIAVMPAVVAMHMNATRYNAIVAAIVALFSGPDAEGLAIDDAHQEAPVLAIGPTARTSSGAVATGAA